MAGALTTLPTTLKLLSDPTRLRLCALLARHELAVQEIVAVTGLQQSRVSNHLSLLKRAGVVRDRREGSWSFHSLVEPSADGPLSPELFMATVQRWLESEEGAPDGKALAAVLDRRRSKSREMHDRLADQWAGAQDFALGTLRSEILAMAWPCGDAIVDLGCGTGFLADWLAGRGARVIGVDHSARMLAEARRRAEHEIEYRQGEFDALPLGDCEVDGAFANLVWHHLPDHEAAAREVYRVLRPGGTFVVSDMAPHDSDWMREFMGDLRLGLRPESLIAVLARAGFEQLTSEPVRDRYRVSRPDSEPVDFPMFVVRGRRPAAAAIES